MERYLFSENDPRAQEIYKQYNENVEFNKDYFIEDKREDNLEDLFESADLSLAENSKKVKLKLLKKIKKNNLDLFSYFNNIEEFFNKYYYDIELMTVSEENIKKFFD